MKIHLFGSKLKFLAAAFLLLLVGLVLAAPGTAVAQSTNVTFTVTDSENIGLSGVGISYYNGYWRTLGTTDSSGALTASVPDGSWSFKASYGGTIQTKTGTVPGDSIQFQTAKATVHVTKSDSSNLAGVGISYYRGYWQGIGNTGSDGTKSVELFPGNIDFRASIGGTTSQTKVMALAGSGTTVEFQTAKATAHVTKSDGSNFAGVGISYYRGYWQGIGNTGSDGTKSVELFPGNIDFRASIGGTTSQTKVMALVLPGTTVEFQTAKATAHVTKSDGSNFAGVGISYYRGYWQGIGNTGSDGMKSVELFPGNISFRASVGGTTSQTKVMALVLPGTTVEFQTAKATAVVQECNGTPIAGAGISYYRGYWQGIGNTSGDGTASVELFPGSINFRAAINGTTSATQTLTLTSPGSTATFSPAVVNIYNSGALQYYRGYWQSFTSPIYMFPGTYAFRIDGVQQDMTVSGCSLSGAMLTLLDHNGNGLAGGTARWADGSWHGIPGQTDANGRLWADISNPNFGKISMSINQGAEQQNRAQLDASGYTWQTAEALVQLVDHSGAPITNGGGHLLQGGSYWQDHGYTDANGQVSVQVFPGSSYKFKMVYNNSSQIDWFPIVAPSTPVIFQTVAVDARLEDSDGNGIAGGSAARAQGSWIGMGTTDAGGNTPVTEILPGSFKFRMSYQGKSTLYENYAIALGGTNEHTVVFGTTTVCLNFSGNIKYSAGSWYGFPSNGCKELLPGSYNFKFDSYSMTLDVSGDRVEKSIVVAKLLDSAGNGLAGGDFDYRFGYGSYASMGTTPADGTIVYAIDGLHTNTKFRVSYAGGTTGDKQQNIAADSYVVFQTAPVTAVLNDSFGDQISNGVSFQYRYGYNPYQTFTSPMELLPLNTKIRVSYAGASVEKQQNVAANPNFVFNTVAVTAVLNNSGGSPINSGVSYQYRYSYNPYQTFTSPMELLPVNTKIRVYYAGTSLEKQQNVGTNPDFVFNTVSVTAVLNDHLGNPINSGVSYQYRYSYNPYKTFTSSMELLPVNTKVRVYYAGTSLEKQQNVATNAVFTWQTGSVTSATCTRYRYGYNPYQSFANGMELLPVLAKFSDANGPDVTATPIAGSTINVTCQ